MLTLTLLSLLAAQSDTTTEVERPAVWAQPVSLIGTATIAALTGIPIVAVPLGVSFSIGTTEVAAELTPTISEDVFLVSASFGPVVHAHRGTWLDGFFVQPKAHVEGGLREGQASIVAHVAVDFGYQIRRGPLYVAFVLGGGVGYGLSNMPFDGMLSLLIPRGASVQMRSGFNATVNFNALRIGYAF